MTPFERACELADGQTNLAEKMSACSGERYTQQRLSNWRKTGVPTESVRHVAEAVNWQVTPNELRPDIFAHPEDGLPDSMRRAAA